MPSPSEPSLTCREVVDFLMRYLDGELAPEQRREFEHHLEGCPSCLNYLKSYEATVSLGRAAMKDLGEPAAAAVPERLIRAIREARVKNAEADRQDGRQIPRAAN